MNGKLGKSKILLCLLIFSFVFVFIYSFITPYLANSLLPTQEVSLSVNGYNEFTPYDEYGIIYSLNETGDFSESYYTYWAYNGSNWDGIDGIVQPGWDMGWMDNTSNYFNYSWQGQDASGYAKGQNITYEFDTPIPMEVLTGIKIRYDCLFKIQDYHYPSSRHYFEEAYLLYQDGGSHTFSPMYNGCYWDGSMDFGTAQGYGSKNSSDFYPNEFRSFDFPYAQQSSGRTAIGVTNLHRIDSFFYSDANWYNIILYETQCYGYRPVFDDLNWYETVKQGQNQFIYTDIHYNASYSDVTLYLEFLESGNGQIIALQDEWTLDDRYFIDMRMNITGTYLFKIGVKDAMGQEWNTTTQYFFVSDYPIDSYLSVYSLIDGFPVDPNFKIYLGLDDQIELFNFRSYFGVWSRIYGTSNVTASLIDNYIEFSTESNGIKSNFTTNQSYDTLYYSSLLFQCKVFNVSELVVIYNPFFFEKDYHLEFNESDYGVWFEIEIPFHFWNIYSNFTNDGLYQLGFWIDNGTCQIANVRLGRHFAVNKSLNGSSSLILRNLDGGTYFDNYSFPLDQNFETFYFQYFSNDTNMDLYYYNSSGEYFLDNLDNETSLSSYYHVWNSSMEGLYFNVSSVTNLTAYIVNIEVYTNISYRLVSIENRQLPTALSFDSEEETLVILDYFNNTLYRELISYLPFIDVGLSITTLTLTNNEEVPLYYTIVRGLGTEIEILIPASSSVDIRIFTTSYRVYVRNLALEQLYVRDFSPNQAENVIISYGTRQSFSIPQTNIFTLLFEFFFLNGIVGYFWFFLLILAIGLFLWDVAISKIINYFRKRKKKTKKTKKSIRKSIIESFGSVY